MNEIVCVFLLWILFIFSLLISRKIYSPIVVFSFVWSVIITLYSFHLYGLFYAKEDHILYLYIGIVFFVLGCISVSKFSVRKNKPNYNLILNEKALELLVLFAIIVLGYGSIYNLQNISLTVHTLRYGGAMNISNVYIILRDFFAVPIVYVCICYFVALLLSGCFKLKWLTYTSLLVLLDILSLFEQIGVYVLALCVIFLFLFIIQNEKHNLHNLIFKRLKKYFRIIGISMTALLILVVNLREIDLVKQVYSYIANSVTLFSIDMSEFQSVSRSTDIGMYTYGLASLQGIFRLPLAIIEGVFGYTSNRFESASYFYATYLAYPKYISSHGLYNSFATMFIYFYKDFGLIGIPVMSFVYGAVSQMIYKRFEKNKDIFSIAMYVFIFTTFFFTYIQSPFTDKKYAFAIVWLILLRKKEHNRDEVSSGNCNI